MRNTTSVALTVGKDLRGFEGAGRDGMPGLLLFSPFLLLLLLLLHLLYLFCCWRAEREPTLTGRPLQGATQTAASAGK